MITRPTTRPITRPRLLAGALALALATLGASSAQADCLSELRAGLLSGNRKPILVTSMSTSGKYVSYMAVDARPDGISIPNGVVLTGWVGDAGRLFSDRQTCPDFLCQPFDRSRPERNRLLINRNGGITLTNLDTGRGVFLEGTCVGDVLMAKTSSHVFLFGFGTAYEEVIPR